MAQCQVNGPLMGPLRERRRSELAQQHPVWQQSREFQTELVTLQQTIRRAPGIPSQISEELCNMMIEQSQKVNNAIRETVDDASELRLQLDEAHTAIMGLKIQETSAKCDLEESQKRVKDMTQKIDKVENRLAKYHADAENDRNALREVLARLSLEQDEEAKSKIMDDLLHTLRTQLEVRYSIEPDVEPVEVAPIDRAMAAFKEAQQAARGSPRPEDAVSGKYNAKAQDQKDGAQDGQGQLVTRRAIMDHPFNTPTKSAQNHDTGSRFVLAAPSGWAPRNNSMPNLHRGTFSPRSAPHSANGFQRPPSSFNVQSPNGHSIDPEPPTFAIEQRSRPSSRGAHGTFRPEAPEFHPAHLATTFSSNGGGGAVGSACMDQVRNTTYGHHRRYDNNRSPVSYGRNTPPYGTWHRGGGGEWFGRPFYPPMARGGGSHMHPPQRPYCNGNPYENRVVIARSQPGFPLGQQTFAAIPEDLERFQTSFRDIFNICRHYVSTWVAVDCRPVETSSVLSTHLPSVYDGFSEKQAWAYVRQHMSEHLSRCCLLTRVLVNFLIRRVFVPNAWQGFNFNNDNRLQRIEQELSRGPIQTGSAHRDYMNAVHEVVNSILESDRYEHYREGRIQYFAAEVQEMLGPLMNSYIDKDGAAKDLNAVLSKAWSLSAKTLTSPYSFEFRFPDAGSRYSMRSMVAIAPNIHGNILQAEHWRIQLVMTPVITVRHDDGSMFSVNVINSAEVILMK